jgi:hypothetical protein
MREMPLARRRMKRCPFASSINPFIRVLQVIKCGQLFLHGARL